MQQFLKEQSSNKIIWTQEGMSVEAVYRVMLKLSYFS